MDAARERRVLDLFEEALAWPEAERERRLAELAPQLAGPVRELLRREASGSGFLPTQPPEPVVLDEGPPPERLGPYRITGLIGRGGMGAVYAAERDDGVFEQSVAVKLMRPGLFGASAAEQFARERSLLARLRHPGIARLYDGGVDAEGRSWIVMERLEGEPITAFAESRRLPLEARLRLFATVCEAVHHAHQALIVHADIKPANVLVETDGAPKLVDFGLARSLAETDAPGAGFGLSEPYASPQRRAGARPTPADDVYALGVLLGELVDPVAPRRRERADDLRAVIAKATASAAADRHPGALALAEDVRRWLERRPVLARPPSRRRAAWLFLSRHPLASGAAAAAAIGLVLAAGVTTTLYLRAERERAEAERRFADARGMASYMLFDLMEALNHTPGTIGVRRELADTARGYLERLTASPKAPPDVRVEAALGYIRLAGVLGFSSGGQLGRRGEAGAMLERADRLLAARTGAGDARWLHARGRLRMHQGFAALNDGKTAQARPLLAEAESVLAQVAQLRPADPEPLMDLWETRLNEADRLAADGEHAASERLLRRELALADSRRPVLAEHDKFPLLLSRTEGFLGNARFYQDDVPGALAAYRRQIAVLEAENARRPDRSRTIAELIKAWWNEATTLDALGRTAEALPILDRAVVAGRDRLRVDGEHEGLHRVVSLVVTERAGLLARTGRGAQAVAEAQADLALRRARAAAKPNDPVLAFEHLSGVRPLGEIKAAVGRPAEACADFRAALAGWDDYARRWPLYQKVKTTEIALLREKLAACRS